jgi:hypothetical protein
MSGEDTYPVPQPWSSYEDAQRFAHADLAEMSRLELFVEAEKVSRALVDESGAERARAIWTLDRWRVMFLEWLQGRFAAVKEEQRRRRHVA